MCKKKRQQCSENCLQRLGLLKKRRGRPKWLDSVKQDSKEIKFDKWEETAENGKMQKDISK